VNGVSCTCLKLIKKNEISAKDGDTDCEKKEINHKAAAASEEND